MVLRYSKPWSEGDLSITLMINGTVYLAEIWYTRLHWSNVMENLFHQFEIRSQHSADIVTPHKSYDAR